MVSYATYGTDFDPHRRTLQQRLVNFLEREPTLDNTVTKLGKTKNVMVLLVKLHRRKTFIAVANWRTHVFSLCTKAREHIQQREGGHAVTRLHALLTGSRNLERILSRILWTTYIVTSPLVIVCFSCFSPSLLCRRGRAAIWSCVLFRDCFLKCTIFCTAQELYGCIQNLRDLCK